MHGWFSVRILSSIPQVSCYSLVWQVAQRDDVYDATKMMLKHASQVYTTRSLLELKIETPEDLAAAGTRTPVTLWCMRMGMRSRVHGASVRGMGPTSGSAGRVKSA